MMFTETCKSQSDIKPLKRRKNKMILNLIAVKKNSCFENLNWNGETALVRRRCMLNEGSRTEEIIPELFADLLTKVRNGLSQWDGFWTGFNAILSITTIRNTTFLHQHVQSFIA